MERLAEWLRKELSMEAVSFVEKHSHGRFLRGIVQGRQIELLVTTSGHVWVRQAGEPSWKTTGVYVPDRVIF